MKERIGDALRNAGMRFGAALDLWHKGELHDNREGEQEAKDRIAGEIALEAAAINKCKSMEELQSAYILCKHKKAVEAYKDTMKIKLSEGK